MSAHNIFCQCDCITRLPDRIYEDVRNGFAALYIHRLDAVVGVINPLFEKGLAQGEVRDILPTVDLLLALLYVMGLPQTSPYLRTFLRSQPLSASQWSTFITNCAIPKPYAATCLPLPLTVILDWAIDYIIVSKPLLFEKGGDGQSCLTPVYRAHVSDSIYAWMNSRAMQPHEDVRENVHVLLSLVDDIRSLIRSTRRNYYHDTKKATFGKCAFCMENQAIAVCGDCKAFMYCSRQCQRAAWPKHRICCFTAAERLRGIDPALLLQNETSKIDDVAPSDLDLSPQHDAPTAPALVQDLDAYRRNIIIISDPVPSTPAFVPTLYSGYVERYGASQTPDDNRGSELVKDGWGCICL